MKKSRLFYIATLWCAMLVGLSQPASAQDDGKEHATENVRIYLDFSTNTPFYTMYINNGIMTPLSEGFVNVSIETSLLSNELSEDMANGALKLQIVEDPANTIIKGTPVSVYNNTPVQVPFTLGYLTPDMNDLYFTINLYNSSSGKNMLLQSSEKNIFQPTDDSPVGKITSINESFSINDTSIINGEQVQIQGWAFDDNDSMAITLYHKEGSNDFEPAVAQVNRSVNQINETTPYWGSSYPSGFDIVWEDATKHGYYDITVKLQEDEHNVELDPKKIFWNKSPIVEIDSPTPHTDIYSAEYTISGQAIDLDVDTTIAAYLSSVEIYLDDPSNTIAHLSNNERANEVMDFSFTWDTIPSYSEGEHTLYIRAHDSFGLISDITEIPIVIYKTTPSVISLSPRLGPWGGDTVVSIAGEGLGALSQVFFGDSQATILQGANDSLVQVQVNPLVPSSSQYVEIRLSNDYGSYFQDDAYRFIPAELNALSISTADIIDMYYANLSANLYLLNNSTHTIDIYEYSNLTLNYDKSLSTSGHDALTEQSMEVSRLEDMLFVTYNDSNIIDIYDLTNNGTLIDSIALTDTESTPLDINSITYLNSADYLQSDTLLIGTSGSNTGLYMITLDLAADEYLIEEIDLEGNYETVEVYGCTNKSSAYILAKNISANQLSIYYYDAFHNLISNTLPSSLSLTSAETSDLQLAVNYKGSEFIAYSNTQSMRCDRYGTQLSASSSGADSVVYDACRPICYTINKYADAFHILPLNNLSEELTYCNFLQNSMAYPVNALDWNGNVLFTVTQQGIAVSQIDDIYPEIRNMPPFVIAGTELNFNVHNVGEIPDNVTMSSKNGLIASSYDADNDTHTIPALSYNETTVSPTLYGYPGKTEKLYVMQKLNDIVDKKNGLNYFYPAGLFYDKIRGDLYAFDPSQTGGFSIARFHIQIDNDGSITCMRKNIPPSMQVANPISMTRVHDYILVLSLYSRQCSWFNVADFDATGSAEVRTAGISPYITPSGVVGYSPAGHSDINYAYLWNSVSTGGVDIFQLDLESGLISWCSQIISPHTTDIYIDYNESDYTSDRAYAVSSLINNAPSDFVSVFEPFKPANQIERISMIFFDHGSAVYKLASNSDHMFALLKTGKGIILCDPDLSGDEFHTMYPLLYNDYISSRFFAVDANNLVFSGKELDNSFGFSIMDVNTRNDYPFIPPFDVTANYNISTAQIYDMELIEDNMFIVIGNTIYIINLAEKEE